MIPGRISDATRVLGKSQGYRALPVRDGLVGSAPDGHNVPCMISAWLPMPDEIARIAAGAPVILKILGGPDHPPVAVEVGEVPK